jgi:NitT/TauT family transport system permease protein
LVEPRPQGRVSQALNAAWIRPFLFLVFIVIVWDLSIRLFHIPPYQIPAPADVVAVLWQDWPELLRQTWPTTYATLGGFLASAAFGIPVAMLIAGSKTVESYIYPLLVFSQSVPKVAIAPLFVVWFGFGMTSKVVIASVLAFFPILLNTLLGVKSVDRGHREVLASLNASRWQSITQLEFPSALPYILTGMEIGVVLSIIGAVVGEYLGGNEGLGNLAVRDMNSYDTTALFAVIIHLALIGFLFYAAIVGLRRLLIPWHESARTVEH